MNDFEQKVWTAAYGSAFTRLLTDRAVLSDHDLAEIASAQATRAIHGLQILTGVVELHDKITVDARILTLEGK